MTASDEPQAAVAPRFAEIEGLRGYLAWTVVVSHVFVVLDVYAGGYGRSIDGLGQGCVAVFMLISGFVIAGLVIERQEKYPAFIVRRAFRIFPAYLIALVIGAIGTPLALQGLSNVGWEENRAAWWYFQSMQGGLASTEAHPWAHWLLHLTLLQGVVPDNILPWSAVTFVGPAWSLSLEWQFYLLAPAIILGLRSPKWAAWIVAIAFLGVVLFHRQVFGTYGSGSMLLAGLWLFVIGIASRLAMPWLRATPAPLAAIVFAALGLSTMAFDLWPLFFWAAFLALLARRGQFTSSLDRTFAALAEMLFASKLATTLGARSYSVYVIHIPLMKLLVFVLPLYAMSHLQAALALAATALPATLLASELMFRFVERPMMRTGAQLARAYSKPGSLRAAA